MSCGKTHDIQCRTVAELGHNYRALDAVRAALDEHIGRAITFDPATPTLDQLWTELEDVLSQQEAVLTALAETAAATVAELRIRADVLDRLMRRGGESQVETQAERMLAASIVHDIQTLFHAV